MINRPRCFLWFDATSVSIHDSTPSTVQCSRTSAPRPHRIRLPTVRTPNVVRLCTATPTDICGGLGSRDSDDDNDNDHDLRLGRLRLSEAITTSTVKKRQNEVVQQYPDPSQYRSPKNVNVIGQAIRRPPPQRPCVPGRRRLQI